MKRFDKAAVCIGVACATTVGAQGNSLAQSTQQTTSIGIHSVATQEKGFWGDVGKGGATGAAGGCAAGLIGAGVGCGAGALAGGVAGGVGGAAGWAWDKIFD